MGFLNDAIPNPGQWFGLLMTIAGTLLTVWAVVSARGAKQQAREAKEAAIALGRVLQLSDLISDMQELQAMLARKDFDSIAAKCTHLRGRVVRFTHEAYNELSAIEHESLNLTRAQLEGITRVASVGKGLDENRIGKIQMAFGLANEELHKVFANRRKDAPEET